MRPHGATEQLERRRRQAIRLLHAGKSLSAVARAVRRDGEGYVIPVLCSRLIIPIPQLAPRQIGHS